MSNIDKIICWLDNRHAVQVLKNKIEYDVVRSIKGRMRMQQRELSLICRLTNFRKKCFKYEIILRLPLLTSCINSIYFGQSFQRC